MKKLFTNYSSNNLHEQKKNYRKSLSQEDYLYEWWMGDDSFTTRKRGVVGGCSTRSGVAEVSQHSSYRRNPSITRGESPRIQSPLFLELVLYHNLSSSGLLQLPHVRAKNENCVSTLSTRDTANIWVFHYSNPTLSWLNYLQFFLLSSGRGENPHLIKPVQ